MKLSNPFSGAAVVFRSSSSDTASSPDALQYVSHTAVGVVFLKDNLTWSLPSFIHFKCSNIYGLKSATSKSSWQGPTQFSTVAITLLPDTIQPDIPS